MTWAEQTITSLILPSDVDRDNPDRNYMIIGDEVPTELVDHFTTALVWHNKNAVTLSTSDSLSLYWALGVTKTHALELVGYFRQFAGFDPITGVMEFTYFLQTMFSVQKYFGITEAPRIFLNGEGAGSLNEMAFVDIYANITGNIKSAIPDDTFMTLGVRWEVLSNIEYGTSLRAIPDGAGNVSLYGAARYTFGTTTTAANPICTINNVALRPLVRLPFECVYSTTTGGVGRVRVDVMPNGTVQFQPSGITLDTTSVIFLSGISYNLGA